MDSPRRPEQVVLMPGAGAFLRGLREHGFRIVVVTNQPGLAKGTLTEPELNAVNTRLAELLAEEGGAWDELRYCPHHPKAGPGTVATYVRDCDCRKPKPGLLTGAAAAHSADMARSWMIGDGIVDVQAGRAAGCRTMLVCALKLNGIEKFMALDAVPDAVAGSLAEALTIITKG